MLPAVTGTDEALALVSLGTGLTAERLAGVVTGSFLRRFQTCCGHPVIGLTGHTFSTAQENKKKTVGRHKRAALRGKTRRTLCKKDIRTETRGALLSYLSKGDSVVEEGMGLVDSGW